MEIDYPTAVRRFDEILTRGLCAGVGEREGQMCVEAAICVALDLPHGDDPDCVEPAVRSYKIAINEANWSSPTARATGLRNVGIAQIGSKGVVDGSLFTARLSEKTIRRLIPALFRQVFPTNPACLAAASRCEEQGTLAAAEAAARAAAGAAEAAGAAAGAADAYLLLSVSLALETLQELKSPGCAYV